MAISGWFHIPQFGEAGHEPGLEEKLAERSSLAQLQSNKADRFDLTRPNWRRISQNPLPKDDDDDVPAWTEMELDWLLQFVNPTYLVPSTVEQLAEGFRDESVITLTDFLNEKFAEKLKAYILKLESDTENTHGTFPLPLGANSDDVEDGIIIGTARPPHKQRFTFRHSHPTRLKPHRASSRNSPSRRSSPTSRSPMGGSG